MNTPSIKKRVALITGGSRGIGLGCAICLAKEGFDIAINGVREASAVAESLSTLRSLGADAIYCRGDIGSAGDRKSIFDEVKAHFGRLNVLVNNVGVAPQRAQGHSGDE